MAQTIDLRGLVRPQLVEATKRDENPNIAEFRIQPLERGFGHTLGNAMRRMLLSSLRGAAVWGFRIDGVVHEHQTIAGVVEDFPAGFKLVGQSGARVYALVTPGERQSGLLAVRLRGQTPEEFAPTLRRIATSVDPMLQVSRISALDAMYAEYATGGAQLALVAALVTGSVILLSAAGIHSLMSFAVNQRRREIGIRAALGAPARDILASVLSRAVRQLALGLGLGLVAAVTLDRVAGGELMDGTGLLLVPGTAAIVLVVGLLAAAGRARRGLEVQPIEALRAE